MGHRIGSPPVRISALLSLVALSTLAAVLFWLISIYSESLRDPRYLDGWILAGGMALQLCFHVAIKAGSSPNAIRWWRKFHMLTGYFLIAAFVLHSNFSWPDTVFEWTLWLGFVLVTLSGVATAYLAWSMRVQRKWDDGISYERIASRRSELARDAENALLACDADVPLSGLPVPPYDAWIADLYANHLRYFFRAPRNSLGHLMGSELPLKSLLDEIDSLARYVDKRSQDKLSTVKALVIEKDRLDFAYIYLGLTKILMFLHVPITYAVIVLTIVHVVVVYAFSAGGW